MNWLGIPLSLQVKQPSSSHLDWCPHQTTKKSIWHYLEHEKQTFMNYGHTWRINKLPLEPTSNFQSPESPFFFGWTSLGLRAISWQPAGFQRVVLLPCRSRRPRSKPHASSIGNSQKNTSRDPMVSSRGIGSSRKQQSGETTPLTQYRSGRVSPDKAETSQRNWRRKQL